MGREDLHHNMEDTFDDKEIIKTGDLVAYDCAYIGRAHLFFSIDFALLLGLNIGRRHIVGEREDPFFALRERHRDVDILFFPSSFHMNSDGRQRVLLPRPHRMGARSV